MLGEEEDEDAVSESGVCLGKHLRGSIRTPRPQPLHWVTEGIDGEGDGEYKRGVGEKNGWYDTTKLAINSQFRLTSPQVYAFFAKLGGFSVRLAAYPWIFDKFTAYLKIISWKMLVSKG